MKRILMLLFLLGTMTAMAQEDFNVLHFNPQGPKVKQVIVAKGDAGQDIYLFDTLGRNYAKGWRRCDTMPFPIKPIDTVSHYSHRIKRDHTGWLAIDSLFFDSYITERDSILKGCSLDYWMEHYNSIPEGRQIYDTTFLTQISYIDFGNDTLLRERYGRWGGLWASNYFLYDDNHNVKKLTVYEYGSNGGVELIHIVTFDKKGNIISIECILSNGRKDNTTYYKRDRHGNITRHKGVIYNVPDGERKWVHTSHYKYKYDKHGNWTS
ncbi:MAG: hypothetical protein HUJ93_09220, partial [Bacteroidales bacterium]|nr:hypothetical protein [Bacteroidales bacterium]